MIRPDSRLVKSWRGRIRALVKKNPELARRRKAVRRWNRPLNPSFVRWIFPIAAAALTATGAGRPDAMIGLGLFWTLSVIFNRAQLWAAALSTPDGLWLFYQNPVSNDAVFRHQRHLLLRASIWLGVDWLAGTAGWAYASGNPALWALAPLVAAAQWAVGLALALWLVHLWPRAPYIFGSLGCWVALVFGAQQKLMFLPTLLRLLETIFPGGWVAQGLRLAAAGHASGWIIIVATGAGAAWMLHRVLAQFRRRFQMESVFDYVPAVETAGSPESLPADAPPAPVVGAAPAIPPVDLGLLRQRMADTFRQPPGAFLLSRSWIERVLARLLSKRLRVLADFFRPASNLVWGRGWLLGFGGLALAFLLKWIGVSMEITRAVAVISLLFALPVLGGNWPGFSGIHLYQTLIGMNSLLPIGFWETARLMLVTNAFRIGVALPLLLLAARHAFTVQSLDLVSSLDWAGRVTVALLVIQPVWVMVRFSQSSNDTSARWWLTTLLVMALIAGAFVLTVCGVAMFGIPEARFAYLAGLPAFAYSHLLLLAYGWAYRRGLFDLINPARPVAS